MILQCRFGAVTHWRLIFPLQFDFIFRGETLLQKIEGNFCKIMTNSLMFHFIWFPELAVNLCCLGVKFSLKDGLAGAINEDGKLPVFSML